MTTPINEHNMLTLDFWRDTVTYEGKTIPVGTMGCETLNIPDTVIERLNELCKPVNRLLEAMNQQRMDTTLLPDARKAAEGILTLLRDVPPFDRLDMDFYLPGISKAFTPEGLKAYCKAQCQSRFRRSSWRRSGWECCLDASCQCWGISPILWRNTKAAWSASPFTGR